MADEGNQLNLWICGNKLAQCFDVSKPAEPAELLWEWDSAAAADLSAEQREWFCSMDEIKPVLWQNTPCLLCTASWRGGVVLIRRKDRAVLFAAAISEAHSADLLPDGRLIVAGAKETHRLYLFHIEDGPFPGSARAELELQDAHGVVFDASRGEIWATGTDQLVRVACEDRSMRIVHRVTLPEAGAHDLSPHPRDGSLILTTATRAWRFDPRTDAIAPFEPLAAIPKLKSISIHPRTGLVAFQKGEAGNWWSDTAYILSPDGCLQTCVLPGRRLYKVRWDRLHQL